MYADEGTLLSMTFEYNEIGSSYKKTRNLWGTVVYLPSESGTNFIVSADADWITCKTSSPDLYVYLNSYNTTESARTGTVTVTNKVSGKSVTLKVTQNPYMEGVDYVVETEILSSATFDYNETSSNSVCYLSETTVYLSSGNINDLAVSVDVDWISYIVYEYNTSIRIYPNSYNTTGIARTGTVTITNTASGRIATKSVTQNPES